MRENELNEGSPLTLEGSFTKDLIFSKFWLCDRLSKCLGPAGMGNPLDVIVLGAWYGNMGLILPLYPIMVKKLVLVDRDRNCVNTGRLLTKHLPFEVETRMQDARDVSYGSPPQLVINTSCNDMQDPSWYRRIPAGSMVALQSRDDHETISEMDDGYPMSRTLFLGSKSLRDPEMSYQRLMKIGIK